MKNTFSICLLFSLVAVGLSATSSNGGNFLCELTKWYNYAEVNSFISEYWHAQDSLFINGKALNWTDPQYLNATGQLVDTYWTDDGNFTVSGLPPIVGAIALKAGFYTLRLFNGGETRVNGGRVLSCTDDGYSTYADTRADTLPLNPFTRQNLGVIRFILSTAQVDVVRTQPRGQLKISKIFSDQRGTYVEANLTSPWTAVVINAFPPNFYS